MGHIISQNGIEPDPEKVKALILLAAPSTSKQLQTFVEKVKYMSRFIHLASQLLYPLQQAMRREPLQWDEECEGVFEKVKEVLGGLSSVQAPDFSQTFYVNPSFGPDAVGAILMQKGEGSRYMKPVYYASRVKTEAERRYTEAELVLSSLVYACR